VKREIELKRRLRSLQGLGEAVGAMKSLSAHHFREARRAVTSARRYRDGVERIAGWASASLPAGHGSAGLLVIGAELGLCGGYNAQLVEAGMHQRKELGDGPTFCVGRRAAIMLGRRDVTADRTYPGPTGVQGITGLLVQLAQDILTTYAAEDLSSFDIVSSTFAGVGKTTPTTIRLLPVAPRNEDDSRTARYARPDHFVRAVIREFLYITLYDLLLDGLASEHGARLAATEAAESWLDERSERLRRHLLGTRREAATQEVLEIVAGARARSDDE
jgi:F-type H+-transporting ATPase subunit gamma